MYCFLAALKLLEGEPNVEKEFELIDLEEQKKKDKEKKGDSDMNYICGSWFMDLRKKTQEKIEK